MASMAIFLHPVLRGPGLANDDADASNGHDPASIAPAAGSAVKASVDRSPVHLVAFEGLEVPVHEHRHQTIPLLVTPELADALARFAGSE